MLFFYNIGKPAEAQALRPDPDAPHRHQFVFSGCLAAITSLVPQRSFKGMGIVYKLAEYAFVVKTPRTVFQGVQVRKSKLLSRLSLFQFFFNLSPRNFGRRLFYAHM